jgi:hypothetical protein
VLVLLIVLGVIWGAWLGRREAAHIGVGIGSYGFAAGILLGGFAGLGVSLIPVAWAIAACVALAAGTGVLVRYY